MKQFDKIVLGPTAPESPNVIWLKVKNGVISFNVCIDGRWKNIAEELEAKVSEEIATRSQLSETVEGEGGLADRISALEEIVETNSTDIENIKEFIDYEEPDEGSFTLCATQTPEFGESGLDGISFASLSVSEESIPASIVVVDNEGTYNIPFNNGDENKATFGELDEGATEEDEQPVFINYPYYVVVDNSEEQFVVMVFTETTRAANITEISITGYTEETA